MKKTITAYRVGGVPMQIRKATHQRDWMDNTNQGYAYRCLPLIAANTYGWELLCPGVVKTTWNGGDELPDIVIYPAPCDFLVSHFGYGIITFHIPYLFRTSKDVDLLVSGPVNRPKRGAESLEGIVETSWAPMTFTMNWQLTSPGSEVVFEKDEPICRIVPVPRNFLEKFDAQIVEHMPQDVRIQHEDWSERRRTFLEKLIAEDPETVRQSWMKDYFRNGKVVKLPNFKHA